MDDNKVYEPEVVSESPYPNEIISPIGLNESGATSGTVSPQVSRERNLPIKRSAIELMSTSLNTKSRKILQNFELQQSGGLQIGNFQDGQTGDIKITPNGVVARNSSGVTTFALDGDTGDASFAGEIKSGSLVSGQVIVGNNRIIIDGENQTIIVNDGSYDRILIGYQENGF